MSLLSSYSQRTVQSSKMMVILFLSTLKIQFHCLLVSIDDSEKSTVNPTIDPFERLLFSLLLLTSSLFSSKCPKFTVVCLHTNFSLFTLLGIQWTSGSEVWYLYRFHQVIGHYLHVPPAPLLYDLLLELCRDVHWVLSLLLDSPLGSTSGLILFLAVSHLLFNLSIEFQIPSILFLISVSFLWFFFQIWLCVTVSYSQLIFSNFSFISLRTQK